MNLYLYILSLIQGKNCKKLQEKFDRMLFLWLNNVLRWFWWEKKVKGQGYYDLVHSSSILLNVNLYKCFEGFFFLGGGNLICHKYSFRVKDECIRFWWPKVKGQGYCDLVCSHSFKCGVLEVLWDFFFFFFGTLFATNIHLVNSLDFSGQRSKVRFVVFCFNSFR